MKKLKLIFGIASLFLLTFITACGQMSGVRGNGNVISQDRDIENFTSVSASSGLDVFVKQGDAISLRVDADDNIIDLIITEVKDGKLIIKTSENIRRAKKKSIYLTLIDIDKLSVSAGCDFVSETVIKSDILKISVSSGADVDLQLDIEKLKCSVSSGADVDLLGKANHFEASASSGSDLVADGLISQSCQVHASSGGDVSVNAQKSINAKATSGGDIHYFGSPAEVNVKSTSGGDINKR